MTFNNCEKINRVNSGSIMNDDITLFKTGYTLVLSNNPEYLGGQQLKQQAVADEGLYLYRDVILGRGRIFFYHYNNTKAPVKLAVAVRSPELPRVHIYINRAGIAVHNQSIMAGTLAWQGWLMNRPNGSDTYWGTVGTGEMKNLALSQATPVDSTVCGVLDILGIQDNGNYAPIEITVYALWDRVAGRLVAAKPDPYYQQLPNRPNDDPCFHGQTIQYGDACFEASVRGTFPMCSRIAYVPWSTANGPRHLELFNRHSSPRALKGEFEPGVDATTNQTVYVASYGVDYTLLFSFINDGKKGSLNGYLQNPYDSGQYFILSELGNSRYCGPFSGEQAWRFTKLRLDEAIVYPLWTTIPGGFSGKQQIIWN